MRPQRCVTLRTKMPAIEQDQYYNVPGGSDSLQSHGTRKVVQCHLDEETVMVAPSELHHPSLTSCKYQYKEETLHASHEMALT